MRFFTEYDSYLFHQGTNYNAYDSMGAHFANFNGRNGVIFRVWAPRADAVSVVGAVIRDGERVLMAQRPEGKAQAGLWEFPGGKIEPGETPEEALARECREELALEIENPSVLRSVVHRYPEKTIRLILVECSVRPGSVPVPQEGQSVAWVRPSDLDRLPVCPADKELLPFVFA